MSDGEFFGVKDLPLSKSPDAGNSKPDWYQDFVGNQSVFTLWHDNVPAFIYFAGDDEDSGCQTQWRHGFDGITGLDYAAITADIALLFSRKSDQRQMMADIKAIEKGAMTAINEQRQAAREKVEKEKAKNGK